MVGNSGVQRMVTNNILLNRIDKELYAIKVIDKDTFFFESLWEIPERVSYNSYLLLTNEGAVVFDTVKSRYAVDYIETIKSIVDPRDIRYIVIHHMEPDHSGAIKELLSNYKPTVLGHPLTRGMLQSFYGVNPEFKPVQDGAIIKVGEFSFRFIHAPWQHWPETILTLVEEKSYLFSCDLFGSYGRFSNIYLDELSSEEKKKYEKLYVKYYANVVGSFRDWTLKAVEKLRAIRDKVREIHPAHGLSLRDRDIDWGLAKYSILGRGEYLKGKVAIVYTSMYGFVDDAAKYVISSLERRGIHPVVYVFNDHHRDNVSELLGDVYESEALVFLTSTYEADMFPLAKHMLELILKKTPVRKVLLIGVYGWGGKTSQALQKILQEKRAGSTGITVETVEFKAGELYKAKENIENALDNVLK